MAKLLQTTPILRSLSEPLARAFYIDYLGFEIVFEHRFAPGMPLYMGIGRGQCALHISEHEGDAQPGSALRIAVDDVDALCAELQAKTFSAPAGLSAAHAETDAQVHEMPWGTRDMSLVDPFGNRLTFCDAVSV